ncbi:unnamed protein product [Merluccius merluccius]
MSAIMEQPFYDDSFLSAYGHPGAAPPARKLLKQNMNVNLADSYRTSSLKSRHLRAAADGDFYPAVTADVGSLKLTSPELDRLIIHQNHQNLLQNQNHHLQNLQNHGITITTSPAPAPFPYGRGITEEQEGFADGFVKALDDLHKMNQMAPPNVSIGVGGSACSAPPPLPPSSAAQSAFVASLQADHLEYTTLNNCTTGHAAMPSYPSTTISYLPHHHQRPPPPPAAHGSHHFQHPPPTGTGGLVHVHAPRFPHGMKEEPQTVPDLHSSDSGSSPPPTSPIDMESQERIKAERKKLRNRLAATKCRRRKLERIARLEDKVKVLKTDNAGLSSTASQLREQVAQLKQKVMTHVSSGCELMIAPKVKSY